MKLVALNSAVDGRELGRKLLTERYNCR